MNNKIAATIALVLVGLLSSAVNSSADFCVGAAAEAPDNGYNFETEQDNWYHYEQGMRMVGIGDWEQAMREFNYYIRQPQMHRGAWGAAYYGLGVMHLKRGNTEAAIDCFKMAITRDRHPRISVADKAYQNIGAIYLKAKDYPKAIENYKKAVEKDPRGGLSHYFLGMSYLKSGDLENAEKEWETSKKLGVSFTALAEGIAEARNPAAKHASDGEPSKQPKRKKHKADK